MTDCGDSTNIKLRNQFFNYRQARLLVQMKVPTYLYYYILNLAHEGRSFILIKCVILSDRTMIFMMT